MKTFFMKRFCFFFLVAFISLGCVFANVNQTNGASEPATRTIIIRLKDHFDAPAYSKRNLVGYKTSAKRGMLVGKMKSFNSESQEGLLNSFQGLKNIKQFWIANIISAEATDEMIEQLRKRSDVESVTIDDKHATFDGETEDSSSLEATGTTAYNVELVRALEANSYGYTGSGVIVGIVDTGVNINHEDLKNSLWEDPQYPNHGWNSAYNNGEVFDLTGHGTHCAGIIVGNGKSGTRTGIAPDAKLMVIRPYESMDVCTQTNTLDAIQFAVDHGANLISMSLAYSLLPNQDKKTWRDAMNNLLSCNVLMVNAAGNEGTGLSIYPIPNNIGIPGSCPAPWIHPEQTVVGGVSSVYTIGNLCMEGDKRWSTSSMGPVTWQGVDTYNDYPYNPGMGLIKPDVSAPGEKITSLDWQNSKGYAIKTGTSMATPCVAGIAALILSKNPDMTPTDIARIISESAVKIAPKFNCEIGAGRADALLATMYTPNPDMNCTGIDINETVGSKNGFLSLGDEANLSFSFKNESNEDVSGQLEIKCLYPHASLTVETNHEIEVEAGSVTELKDFCSIKILPEAQYNDIIDVAVIVKKGDKVWTNLFRFPVCKAELSNGEIQIKEIGNQNGIVEPGEKAELIFPVSSIGTEPCRDVEAILSSTSPYVGFSSNIKLQEISGNENLKFDCSISKDTPKWHTVPLSLTLKGENIDTTFTYKITIGKQAVLIVDRSKSNSSATKAGNYLSKNDYSYSKVNVLPDNLESLRAFHSLWFFNGVYPRNKEVTQEEIEVLTGYVKAGGCLYMEGGDLFYKNKGGMNELMNIDPVSSDGGRLDSIVGLLVDFNADYKGQYTTSQMSIDNIRPIEPAFAMYKNSNPEFITTVAYNHGDYRTIGSSFELGGTFAESGENGILDSYLDFFLISDGYFSTGIADVKQVGKLHVDCFRSGNDCVLDISIPGSSLVTISVYGTDGQMLKQINQSINENGVVRIPNNNYRGVNYIIISSQEGTITKKIIY